MERGTHDSLVKVKGHYYTLWSKQIRSAKTENEVSGGSPTTPVEAIFLNDVPDGTSLGPLVDTPLQSSKGDDLPANDTDDNLPATTTPSAP